MTESALDLTALRSALNSLEDAIGVVSQVQWFREQDAKVKNTLIAGVIQNFEFVYEISVKMIKRQKKRIRYIPIPSFLLATHEHY